MYVPNLLVCNLIFRIFAHDSIINSNIIKSVLNLGYQLVAFVYTPKSYTYLK